MKTKILLAATILALFATVSNSYSQQDVNGWFWLNGKPQGNTVNWAKVIDAANIIALTDRGLFMKSTDGGDTWLLAQAGAPDNSTTGGLSKRNLTTGWFFNANTGIAAGQFQVGESGFKSVISKTTDGGLTWSLKDVNSIAGSSITDFYFINSTTGFLCGGTNAKAYKTTDQGETWTELSSVPDYSYYSIFAFDANNIILGSFPRKIVKSTDGGSSWSEEEISSADANTSFTDILFKDANTGYITGEPNFFGYSTNGGATWTKSNSSSVRGQKTIVYDNGTVWTCGDFQYIYKSTNNGVTWDSVYFRDNTNANQPPPYFVNGMGVNGNDLITVGHFGQVTTSNDGGSSWRSKNYTLDAVYPYYSSILVDSPNGNIWVGNGTDGATNLLYSSNGGNNWAVIPNAMNSPVYSIEFASSSTAYICGGNAFASVGQMSKSTNSGLNWSAIPLSYPLSVYQLNSVDFLDENTGWVAGSSAPFTPPLIAKTTNGGVTWTEQTLETNPLAGVANIRMIDVNNGFLLSHTLYSTTNGGMFWKKTTNSTVLSKTWLDLFVLNKDVIFLSGAVSGGALGIIRSTDGGNTWTDVTSNLLSPVTLFCSKWLNPKDGVVSGTNGFTAITTNGGTSWTQSNPGFSTTVDLAFPNKNVWFTISDRNSFYQIGRKYETNSTISVNPIIGIEGFWNGTSQIVDTVTLQLRSSTSPYNIIASKKSVLTPSIGYGSFEFASVPAGSYYVVIKHRNALETWSAAPVAVLPGGNYNYNFTTAASQAYGNNMVLKLGRYCLYSGDVNQDEVVDGSDLSLIDNDGFNFVSGYVATDCNGDNFTDASDAAIADNNAFNTVTVAKP
jgi:photosystem II stability/assembly factor-like uncharacterized protein